MTNKDPVSIHLQEIFASGLRIKEGAAGAKKAEFNQLRRTAIQAMSERLEKTGQINPKEFADLMAMFFDNGSKEFGPRGLTAKEFGAIGRIGQRLRKKLWEGGVVSNNLLAVHFRELGGDVLLACALGVLAKRKSHGKKRSQILVIRIAIASRYVNELSKNLLSSKEFSKADAANALNFLYKMHEWLILSNWIPLAPEEKRVIHACVVAIEERTGISGVLVKSRVLDFWREEKKEEINAEVKKVSLTEKFETLEADLITLNTSWEKCLTDLLAGVETGTIQATHDLTLNGGSVNIRADGFPTENINNASPEKKRLVHEVSAVAFQMNVTGPVLSAKFERMKSQSYYSASALVDKITKSEFFVKAAHELVADAIIAWDRREYVSFLTLMVPQLEAALKRLHLAMALPTRQVKNGSVRPFSMTDIMSSEEFIENLPSKNLVVFLRSLYTHEAGLETRNVIAHGQFSKKNVTEDLASWVLLSVLFFVWHKFEPNPKTAPFLAALGVPYQS